MSWRLSDLQVFLNWLYSMDRYFTRYSLSKIKKVRIDITKLTGQASQYWVDVERNRKARFQTLTETWKYMKYDFIGKYVPSIYFDHLFDKWRRISQGNKSAKEYITEFDEFSLAIIFEACRVTSKFFSNLEMDFKKNWYLSSEIMESLILKGLMLWFKI